MGEPHPRGTSGRPRTPLSTYFILGGEGEVIFDFPFPSKPRCAPRGGGWGGLLGGQRGRGTAARPAGPGGAALPALTLCRREPAGAGRGRREKDPSGGGEQHRGVKRGRRPRPSGCAPPWGGGRGGPGGSAAEGLGGLLPARHHLPLSAPPGLIGWLSARVCVCVRAKKVIGRKGGVGGNKKMIIKKTNHHRKALLNEKKK